MYTRHTTYNQKKEFGLTHISSAVATCPENITKAMILTICELVFSVSAIQQPITTIAARNSITNFILKLFDKDSDFDIDVDVDVDVDAGLDIDVNFDIDVDFTISLIMVFDLIGNRARSCTFPEPLTT